VSPLDITKKSFMLPGVKRFEQINEEKFEESIGTESVSSESSYEDPIDFSNFSSSELKRRKKDQLKPINLIHRNG